MGTYAHVIKYTNGVTSKDTVNKIDYGPLPPAISALEPDVIEFDFDMDPQTNPVVRIKIFGAHSTGSWGIPYYGLYIVCSSTNKALIPPLTYGLGPEGHVNKLADFVFEAYQ
jgi:hypothetical protein